MKTFILIVSALFLSAAGLKAQNEKQLLMDISDFKGRQEGDCIRLSWRENNPQNLKEVKVEKSYDGNFFSCNAPVQIVNESGKTLFGCVDHETQGSILYYRLKRCTGSGQSEYSEIIAVEFEPVIPEALVFPNPVRGKEFFVTVAGEKTTLKLYNSDGVLLHYSELNPENNESALKVEVPFVNSGLYRCVIEGKGKPSTLALVVSE